MSTSAHDTGLFRVLILGDGNFSFSLALARHLWHPHHPTIAPHLVQKSAAHVYLGLPPTFPASRIRLLATSFDSRDQLLAKYGDCKDILGSLDSDPMFEGYLTVKHGVNAWELPEQFGSEYPSGFDLIIWNHPHLGTEDFRLHRFLMAHFFHSVAQMLRKPSADSIASDRTAAQSLFIHPHEAHVHRGGRVRVSLVQGQETRWDLIRQAHRAKLSLESIVWFNEAVWPGYVVKRNKHGGSFKNVHTKRRVGTAMESCFFTFGFVDGAGAIGGIAVDESERVHLEVLEKRNAFSIYKDEMSLMGTTLTPGGAEEDGSSNVGVVNQLSDAVQVLSITGAAAPADRDDAASVASSDASKATAATASTGAPRKHGRNRDADQKPSKPSAKELRKAQIPADLVCPHCAKTLLSARAYSQHVHMVHDLKLFGSDWQPQRAKRLPCTQCSKTFATQDDLWQHEINKHSTIDPADLPAAPDNAHLQEAGVPSDAAAHADSGLDALTSRPIVAGNAGASDHDYDYVPCDVCGQAVVRRGWGMLLHLESLKPVIGLDMRCPRCPKTFIEQRALYQHYKFCRLHSADKPASAVGAAVDAAAVE